MKRTNYPLHLFIDDKFFLIYLIDISYLKKKEIKELITASEEELIAAQIRTIFKNFLLLYEMAWCYLLFTYIFLLFVYNS